MSRTKIAALLTALWLAAVITFATINCQSLLQMPPNAWGDFLAGVSAPLAFLWLVVGYFQQGDELRQNTAALKLQEEALKLQVQELKESVQQQKHLVEVTRQDVDLARQSVEAQSRREKLGAALIVRNRGGTAHDQGDGYLMDIVFENVGHLVTDIDLELVDDQIGLTMSKSSFDNWASGHAITNEFRYQKGAKPGACAGLKFSYTDGIGERSELTARLTLNAEGLLEFRHPQWR